MTRRLQGRTAIVTGASRGLGRSTAVALAAEGAGVAVVARTERVWNARLPGTIGETVAEIEAAGGRAVAIQADLTNRDDLPHLLDQARNALGPITILINNAAFTAPGRPPTPGAPAREAKPKPPKAQVRQADWPPFVGTPVHAFRRHFEIAVFAAYELMQLVVPDMINAGGGAIVNISSIASRIPGMGPYHDFSGGVLPGYGGSKAALEHLTASAAYELQRRNIAVNALSPSEAMMTPGLAYYRTDFDRVGSEMDFAEAVVRLTLVDPVQVTGRTIGHRQVLDGSFAPFAP
jgi:NAD(P)-dependent dehydrogenase (short-subunit alcohol dehydrogenase family)